MESNTTANNTSNIQITHMTSTLSHLARDKMFIVDVVYFNFRGHDFEKTILMQFSLDERFY